MFASYGIVLVALAGVGISTDPQRMVHGTIYLAHNYIPNATWSLLEMRQLRPLSRSSTLDCSQECLSSELCRTAVFHGQNGTCAMYNEHAESDGQIVPTALIDFTTISLEKAASKASRMVYFSVQYVKSTLESEF